MLMLKTFLEVSVKRNLYRLETEGDNRALPRPTIGWYYTIATLDLEAAMKALNEIIVFIIWKVSKSWTQNYHSIDKILRFFISFLKHNFLI